MKKIFFIDKSVGYHFDKKKFKENLSVEFDMKMNKNGAVEHALDMMYICKKVL